MWMNKIVITMFKAVALALLAMELNADTKPSDVRCLDGNVKCHTPFIYDKVAYDGCTLADNDQPWCYTNENNSHWVNCIPCGTSGAESPRCNGTKFKCYNGQCISAQYLCDTKKHCSDNSDESVEVCAMMGCAIDEFRCNSGQCIKQKYHCNGVNDCIDESDEVFWECEWMSIFGGGRSGEDYEIDSTKPTRFTEDPNRCLNDTVQCHFPFEYKNVVYNGCIMESYDLPWCYTNENKSHWVVCVPCDTDIDATQCSKSGQFKCFNGECINDLYMCDSERDCHDGTDEIDLICDRISCRGSQFHCKSGQCTEKANLCNGNTDCKDGSDETTDQCAAHVCGFNTFRCQYGACIHKANKCNGNIECVDGSDEKDCENTTCTSDKWKCDYGACINKDYVCDGEVHCVDKSDETENLCKRRPSLERPIRCNGSTKYISNSKFCDNNFNCNDESDEINTVQVQLGYASISRNLTFPCQNKIEKGYFLRKNKNYESACDLEEAYLCDGISTCRYNADECFCRNNTYLENAHYHNNCFKCMNHALVIAQTRVCDGKIDCDDMSDECLCEVRIPQCNDILNNSYVNGREITTMERRRDIWSTYYGNKELEDFLCCTDYFCRQNLTNTTNCRQCTPFDSEHAIFDDGIPTCEKQLREECNSKNASMAAFCKLQDVPGSLICNGQDDKENEEIGCTHRYYCNSTSQKPVNPSEEPINIAQYKVCDGVPDCYDQSDEMNCSMETHFYCKSKNLKFILRKQVCDNQEDCDDGSDECQNCLSSPFSDDNSLIANKALWVLLLAAASISLFGNGYRIFTEIHGFLTTKRSSHLSGKANAYLLLSLAFADLCVAIYLWALIIANEVLSRNQKYCVIDKQWRISNTCKSLGVLMFIGSQGSLLTLVALSVYRLYAILRPLSTRNQEAAPILKWICAIWATNLTLALIPILSLEDYFVTYVEYKSNPLLGTIDKKNNSVIANNLLTILDHTHFQNESNSLLSWKEIGETMQLINPEMTIKYKYHYYSKHGTCLPDFYPKPMTDISYQFSAALSLLNSSCFIVIAVCYGIAYWTVAKSSQAVRSNRNDVAMKRMQWKITLIIVTDMLCWVPIGITTLCSINGVEISEQMYAATATFLLPINSVLNPLIYSDTLDKFTAQIKKIYRGSFHRDDRNTTKSDTQHTQLESLNSDCQSSKRH